jgi:branched-subunit amino acid ABC-type transport system permease component
MPIVFIVMFGFGALLYVVLFRFVTRTEVHTRIKNSLLFSFGLVLVLQALAVRFSLPTSGPSPPPTRLRRSPSVWSAPVVRSRPGRRHCCGLARVAQPHRVRTAVRYFRRLTRAA